MERHLTVGTNLHLVQSAAIGTHPISVLAVLQNFVDIRYGNRIRVFLIVNKLSHLITVTLGGEQEETVRFRS